MRNGDYFKFNLFYSIFKIKTFCKKWGDNDLIKFSVYNMLKLPLVNLVIKFKEKDLALDEKLKDFIEERKDEDNCSNCNSNNVYSKTIIYTLPKYLIINFSRIYDSKYFSNNITYPKYLNIKSDYEKKESSYFLDCVIEHTEGLHLRH